MARRYDSIRKGRTDTQTPVGWFYREEFAAAVHFHMHCDLNFRENPFGAATETSQRQSLLRLYSCALNVCHIMPGVAFRERTLTDQTTTAHNVYNYGADTSDALKWKSKVNFIHRLKCFKDSGTLKSHFSSFWRERTGVLWTGSNI